MRSRRTEFFLPNRVGCAVRWLWPTALLALTPKCLLCLAAYAGLGAALGLGGPEMCGAPAGSPGSWTSSLAWPGVALAGVAVFAAIRRRRARRVVASGCGLASNVNA